MYVLGIRKLRQQLASGAFAEKQAFYYYVATAILSGLTYEAVANSPGSGGAIHGVDFLDGGLDLLFTIGGITWCYLQNGGADGDDFLQRIVPIGWVMLWRALLFGLLPFTILVGFLNWNATGSFGRPETETISEIIIHNGVFLIMFWRMGVHMNWVKNKQQESKVPAPLSGAL